LEGPKRGGRRREETFNPEAQLTDPIRGDSRGHNFEPNMSWGYFKEEKKAHDYKAKKKSEGNGGRERTSRA